VNGADVLVLGITFKENCQDIRNSRVVDVIRELQSFGINVHVHDPHADPVEVRHEYGLELEGSPDRTYKAVILAVAHKEFQALDLDRLREKDTVVFDVKGTIEKEKVTARL